MITFVIFGHTIKWFGIICGGKGVVVRVVMAAGDRLWMERMNGIFKSKLFSRTTTTTARTKVAKKQANARNLVMLMTK